MRDPRLIAVHRGGLLTREHHRLLAAWAADCAEPVLPLFERSRPHDLRPRRAVDAARAWAAGGCTAGEARTASVEAHAAARAAEHDAAVQAARAAGPAAAVAHMADHELGAAFYALRALRASGATPQQLHREMRRQRAALPADVADLVRWDIERRAAKFQHELDLDAEQDPPV